MIYVACDYVTWTTVVMDRCTWNARTDSSRRGMSIAHVIIMQVGEDLRSCGTSQYYNIIIITANSRVQYVWRKNIE